MMLEILVAVLLSATPAPAAAAPCASADNAELELRGRKTMLRRVLSRQPIYSRNRQ